MSPKWSVLMGLLVLGCQSELELPPIIETSEHLVLRGETDVCAGIFEAISLMSTS